jgi:glycosyl transferase family 1
MSDPVRFLSAFTFHPAYLEAFYRQNPELVAASHREQVAALVSGGFSDCHLLSAPLGQLGWTTADVIANDPVSQGAWAREHGFDDVAPPADGGEITRRQIEAFRPTILYSNDVVHLKSALLSVRERPPLVVAWRGFPLPRGLDLSDFDVVLTSFDLIFEEAKAAGAGKVLRFAPGFSDHNPALAEPREIAWDVVLSGTLTRHHQRRIRAIELLARASRNRAARFRFGLFIPDVWALSPFARRLNRGARWAHDMTRLLRSARIVVNVDVDSFGAQPPNMRLIETTGAGAFLLTPAHPRLKELFEPGEEVETFGDENELIAKIDRFLADAEAREAIAARGQERCLRDHSIARRAGEFKAMMESELTTSRVARRS